MSNSQQNKSWSLQDNKRSEDQREQFKPTGKQPKNYTTAYILAAIGLMFLISLALTLSTDKKLEACFFFGHCFNSKDHIIWYTVYVFSTIFVIVFALVSAYLFGKKIAERYQS